MMFLICKASDIFRGFTFASEKTPKTFLSITYNFLTLFV